MNDKPYQPSVHTAQALELLTQSVVSTEDEQAAITERRSSPDRRAHKEALSAHVVVIPVEGDDTTVTKVDVENRRRFGRRNTDQDTNVTVIPGIKFRFDGKTNNRWL